VGVGESDGDEVLEMGTIGGRVDVEAMGRADC
jgi:hypothetical protein